MRCPNCDCPVESAPIRCEVCGYRSEHAREYLWLYSGGAVVAVLGFASGLAGIWAQGAGSTGWTATVRDFFPLAPWPAAPPHWLAFVIAGIGLTLCGLGITRRRRFAWWTMAVFTAWQLGWTLAALAGGGDGDSGSAAHLVVLAGMVALASLLARVGLALRRTPRRDAAAIRARARETLEAAEAETPAKNAPETGSREEP